jgi:hypothetical protein
MLGGFFVGEVRGMFEIAGLAFSAIGLAVNLAGSINDWAEWDEEDLLVDNDWLALAIDEGILDGAEGDYRWSAEDKVATRVLRGTHSVVMAGSEERRTKYRVVRGRESDRLVLTKQLA